MSAPARGLKFYPQSHRYKLDGEWVPGCTTILGVLDKPALKKWAANTVASWVVENPNTVDLIRAKGGHGPTYEFLRAIPFQQRDDAAARGTTLHDYAENLLRGEPVEVDEEHAPVMESALAFLDDWHIEPILIEAPVASRQHKYAGKLDFIAEYTHPVTGVEGVAIYDWKSGRAMYPEYSMQMCAYAKADFHGEDGDEHALPVCDAAFGVQITDEGYSVYPMEFGQHVYEEFLAVRQVYDIAKRMRGDWKVPGSGYVGVPIVAGDAT